MDAFCHVTPPPLQTQQKPRVTEAQHNAEKHFLFYSDVDDDVIVLDDDDPDYMPSASAPATSSRRRSAKKQTTPSKKAQVNK